MKAISILLAALLFLFACSDDESQNLQDTESIKSEPHIAKVIDKITANSYLYLQVSENKELFWIAVP